MAKTKILYTEFKQRIVTCVQAGKGITGYLTNMAFQRAQSLPGKAAFPIQVSETELAMKGIRLLKENEGTRDRK